MSPLLMSSYANRRAFRVHCCAEQYSNDTSISSAVMKALKRAMAAEYSRELGVKCYEGQKRLAQLGFRMGGWRVMVSVACCSRPPAKESEPWNTASSSMFLTRGSF